MLLPFTVPLSVSADSEQRLNIKTKKDKVLFDLYNLAPGDWAVRTLTVQNRGEEDFTYNSSSRLEDGSEKLYNEFLLEVTDAEKVLFSGKMKDFNGFSPRLLKAKHEEELLFKVEFPPELGNDFQGLEFDVVFLFHIEEIVENSTNPGDPGNGTEPNKPNDPEKEKNPGESQPQNPEEEPTIPDAEKPDHEPTPNPISEEPKIDGVVDENPITSVDPPNEEKNPSPISPEQPPEETDEEQIIDEEEEEQDRKEMVVKPQQPMDPDALNFPPSEGQVLPATATNMFNFMVAGLIFIAAGATLLFIIRKRKIAMKY